VETRHERVPLKLCYITDRHAIEPAPLLPRILEAARAGVDLIQIREKDLAARPLVELVRRAVEGARGTRARILVNDRLDIALALHTAGVHLPASSLPASAVRRIIPSGLLVGVSCHSREEAMEAEASGADYILLGPIFETPSKLAYGPPLGLDKLREVAVQLRIPVLALGGITVERVKSCLQAGASGIAGISLFQTCDSLEELVQELKRNFRE
jgi:thiamine-phosphate pyrophosphorylase